MRRHRGIRKSILWGLAAVAAVLAVWGFYIEPARMLRAEVHRLAIPDWPESLEGLRVAVLSDLHVGSPYNGLDKLKEIVDLTNAQHPDLILLTGDYIITGVLGGTFVPPSDMTPTLSKLRAPLGVYAVLGNHDYWHHGAPVTAAMEAAGIPVLVNQNRYVKFRESGFWLAGIDDATTRHSDIGAALEGISAPPSSEGDSSNTAPIIAFTHNPDVFVDMPPRVTLTIAGHTHGGQVYIPFVGRPIVPSRYGQRFAIGHIVEQGRHLFVSSGTGTSIIPVRFLVPPEVPVLVLSHAAD